MKDLFELLAIKPTYDFVEVKEAYMKKVTAFQGTREEATTEQMATFSRLVDFYNRVDSEEKLAFYMNMYHSNPNNKTPMHLYVDVFLTIPLGEKKAEKSEDKPPKLRLPRSTSFTNFSRNFDYAHLADLLTNLSENYAVQIGLTEQEALKIVNLHTHYDYSLIVRVKLPISCITHRATEKEVHQVAHAKDGSNYHWLSRNTVFNAKNIVSVRPMNNDEYTSSIRMQHYQLTEPCLLLPEDMTLINQYAPIVVEKPQQFFSGSKATSSTGEVKVFEFG